MANAPQLPRIGKEDIHPDQDLIEIWDKSSGLMKLTTPSAIGGGGAGLQIKNGATVTTSLQIVADSANTSTALRISTKDVSNFGNSGDESNAAFGIRALNASTNGFNQVAIGMNALQNHNSSYSQNVAIGANALRNAADEQTIAIGLNAGINYTDWYSVFIGSEAKAGATSGTNAVAIGWHAAYNCSTGSNVAVGFEAMANAGASGGDSSVAIGYSAMRNVTGNYNIAIGYSALINGGSSCSNNIAMGYNAINSATTAQHNIGMGELAGRYITTGSNNVAIGSGSGPQSGGGAYVNTLCFGRNALATGSNQVVFGSAAYPYATVTAGSQTQSHYWTVKINGTDYKILLAS